ncbi:leucine-rich transmembrane protein [Culex quinquefasciatus]|uniref:Leucine-rich transmembrane protein n=1 Tax=Culex quinquefasciatus TaxID=7176 RepID=B0WKK1_CULQU|nr:leucine-rich transmembrane protein [Culex quinquefasciatus]|eukprot:XP_001849235.1 leucine-rich transmembrane protein [Culex quinquefasciatus]
MRSCNSSRRNRAQGKVFWGALVLLVTGGGVEFWISKKRSSFARATSQGNESSSIVTAVDMVSPMAVPDFTPAHGVNHTLLLGGNGSWTDPAATKRPHCRCWNSTEFLEEIQCRCEGHTLLRVPQKLTSMQKLTLEKVGIKTLRENALTVFFIYLKDFYKIEGRAFAKLRQLRTLYIAHAPRLQYLESNVFEGISSKLRTLRIINCGLLAVPDMRMLSEHIILHMVDLSGTSIEAMPTEGLSDLEELRIQNTHTLKTIPSVYNFKNLQTAYLTHSFHCCAFRFPARHDPDGHEQNMRRFKENQKKCIAKGYATPNVKLEELQLQELGQHGSQRENSQREKRHAPSGDAHGFGWLPILSRNNLKLKSDHFVKDGSSLADAIRSGHETMGDSFLQPITGLPLEDILREDVSDLYTENPLPGTFHGEVLHPVESLEALCGNLTPATFDVKCYPMPDALNPCEDVMGSHWLRGSVWVVVLLAVFGNVAVLVVLFSNRTDMSVPKFLICHLAFADLCMGLYLLLIASIDAHSMGEYFNFAFDWQYGSGCKVAGFLTVFASHLSIFTLTIVTLERWFAITHAIYLNKRIKLSAATYIMIAGWIYSIVMAALPLVGISNYSSTSICLPMEARDSWDISYLLTVLGINGLAFVIIVICYAQIYLSLGKETRQAARTASSGEMTVAKKMALLVFTNFACWAPIAFFGLTAIAGYPLIDVTKSKILLVFFYPLNSCANPYLYAILTMQYRKDLFMLLSNYGICTQRAQQYKMTYSMPTNTIQIAPARGSITTTTANSTTNGTSCTTVTNNNSMVVNMNDGGGANAETTATHNNNNSNGHTIIAEEEESETFL